MPKTSLEKNRGWLMIDHRNSPGITWDDIKHLPTHVRDSVPLVGKNQIGEFETFTCAHCKTSVIPNPQRVRERAHCHKCMDYVCDLCASGECRPFEALVQAVKGSDKPIPQSLIILPSPLPGRN